MTEDDNYYIISTQGFRTVTRPISANKRFVFGFKLCHLLAPVLYHRLYN